MGALVDDFGGCQGALIIIHSSPPHPSTLFLLYNIVRTDIGKVRSFDSSSQGQRSKGGMAWCGRYHRHSQIFVVVTRHRKDDKRPIRVAECCVVSSSRSIRRFQSLFHKLNRLGQALGDVLRAHARRQASSGTRNETDELIMSMESMHRSASPHYFGNNASTSGTVTRQKSHLAPT